MSAFGARHGDCFSPCRRQRGRERRASGRHALCRRRVRRKGVRAAPPKRSRAGLPGSLSGARRSSISASWVLRIARSRPWSTHCSRAAISSSPLSAMTDRQAPVGYPAAYEGVIAVTSVDGGRRIQVDANRGPEIAFAALGVGVQVAALNKTYATATGTSFAAPLIAARFALKMSRPDIAASSHVAAGSARRSRRSRRAGA